MNQDQIEFADGDFLGVLSRAAASQTKPHKQGYHYLRTVVRNDLLERLFIACAKDKHQEALQIIGMLLPMYKKTLQFKVPDAQSLATDEPEADPYECTKNNNEFLVIHEKTSTVVVEALVHVSSRLPYNEHCHRLFEQLFATTNDAPSVSLKIPHVFLQFSS